MAIRKLLCIGDSVSAGSSCTSPEYAYQAHLLKLLRRGFAQHEWIEVAPLPSGSSPYMGGIWALWENNFRHSNPDLIVLGGIGDNDSSSAVASTVEAISMESQIITFNANVVAGRAYILTDGTNEEVVIPQAISTVTGTRCLRGCMGTSARVWPVGTTVRAWTDRSEAPWADTMEYLVRDILSSGGRNPIVLIGGQVFEPLTGDGNTATAALVAELQPTYPNLEYCPFATSDGTSLFAADASTIYTGPTTTLAQDMADDALEMTVVDGSLIDPGDYIMVTQSSGTPAYDDSEIMLVASKVADVITVEGASERAKLGSSTTNLAFTAGMSVCKMATTTIPPHQAYTTLGTTGIFFAGHWQYDTHPNNRGYLEIGKAFYRGFLRALARTQGADATKAFPFF